MQEALLLVFVITILMLILVYIYTSKEGFFDATSDAAMSQASLIVDRQKQYGNVGVSLVAAGNSGVIGTTATPLTTTPTPAIATGSTITHPLNTEPTGLFAHIQRCEAIKTMDCSAFDDPAFSLNCGVCLDIGTNSAGASIPGGGLVVLDDDKQIAKQNQVSDFMPSYIPTVGFCPAGKLVTTRDECVKLKKQLECQKNQSFDLPGCSQCYSDGSYSIVDPVANPGVIAGHGIITIVGNGVLTINEQGFAPVTNITLNASTPYQYSVQGNEGSSVGLLVNPPSSSGPVSSSNAKAKLTTPVFIAGFISDATFKGEFEMDLMEITLNDRVTGRKPRASGSVNVKGVQVTKMAPGFGQKTMSLVTTIPFTFVDTTTQEAYLCQNGPFVTKPSSVQVLQSDPCYSKGSGPGNYSLECLQNIWLSNGCTQSGKYYPGDASSASLLMSNPDGSFRTSNTIANIIYTNALISSTGITPDGKSARLQEWSDASVFCTGVAITNPCEGPEKNSGPLSEECITYLWKNMGANNSLGATYTAPGGTSLFGGTTIPQFCQAGGTLSPVDQNNNSRSDVVEWWQTKGGVDAVKKIMSNLYIAANAQSSTDEQRMPFFTQCYGPLKLAAQAVGPPAPPPPPPAPPPPPPREKLKNTIIIANGSPILDLRRNEWVQMPPPTYENLKSGWSNQARIKFVISNGTQLLAGGTNTTDGAKLVSSFDGDKWVSAAGLDGYGGSASSFNTAIWSGSRWIASCVNYSKNYITETFSSSDGQNWTEMKIGNFSNHTGIAGTDQLLVSAGMNVNHYGQPATQHSTDGGKTWTVSQSSKSFFGGNGGLMCIAYNGSLFVAGGCENANGGPAIILYSSDGINWNRANISPCPGGRIWSIASNGSQWVGTTQYEGTVFSSDGINWVGLYGFLIRATYGVSKLINLPIDGSQHAVHFSGPDAYGNQFFMSTTEGIACSQNGLYWTGIILPVPNTGVLFMT
jgi:hypothetical protein